MEDDKIVTGLVEDTSTPAAPGIETTDENLSVDQMFQQATLPSLAKQIFSVQPMHGPTAALFNILKKVGQFLNKLCYYTGYKMRIISKRVGRFIRIQGFRGSSEMLKN